MFRKVANHELNHRCRPSVLRCLLALATTSLWTGDGAMATPRPDDAIREASDAPGRPRPDRVYKFVFDMNTAADPKLGFNPGLRALGDLIAEYASYGIDARHRSIVVVLNGIHAEMALTDASYRRLHSGDGNPALDEIKALERLGVVFTVPARDVASLFMSEADIQPGVKIGPRASIVYLDLEAMGYVFSGLKSLTTE